MNILDGPRIHIFFREYFEQFGSELNAFWLVGNV